MQKERLKSRRIIIILAIILLLVIALMIYIGVNYDFTNSLYVMTKDEVNDAIHYYDINDRGKCREREKFEPDEMEEFTVKDCYDSYISDNKVLNKLTLDTCTIEDQTGNTVEMTEEFRKIVKNVAELEHDIFKNKILKIKKAYYVVVELNVNLWSPYCLYYYDRENDELKLLYTFDGEDIIGIKLN